MGFSVSFSVIPNYVNEYSCDEAFESTFELENFLYTLRGPDQATVFDACCQYGGGHKFGMSLMVDPYSDVVCRSIDGIARCGCGCANCRYDILSNSCSSSCLPGQKWKRVVSVCVLFSHLYLYITPLFLISTHNALLFTGVYRKRDDAAKSLRLWILRQLLLRKISVQQHELSRDMSRLS